MRASNLVYIPAIAAVGLLYSAVFPVNKMGAEAGVPYVGFVFWLSLLGMVATGIPAALRRELPQLTWPHLRAYLVLGGLGVAIPAPLLVLVSPKIPVGIVTLLMILVPILTYTLSYFVGIERFRVSGVVGLLFGLGGILLVLVPDLGLPSSDMVGWVLLALAAPFCFAGTNTMAAYLRPPAAPSFAMATGMQASASLLCLPLMFATGQEYLFPGPTTEGMFAVLYAAGITALTMVSWFALVRVVGPVYFSQFSYFVVLGGFVWGILLFDEQPSIYIWIATALTFVGLAVFTRGAQLANRAAA
jgi:drug/metabolite transporter (DMT)-like permease